MSHKEKNAQEKTNDLRETLVKTASGMIDLEDPTLLHEQYEMLAAFKCKEDTFSENQDHFTTSIKADPYEMVHSNSTSPSSVVKKIVSDENHHCDVKTSNDYQANSKVDNDDYNEAAHDQVVSYIPSNISFSYKKSSLLMPDPSTINIQHLDTDNAKNAKSPQLEDTVLVDGMKDPHQTFFKETSDSNDVRQMYKHHGITIRGKRSTWNAIANGGAMLVQCNHCLAYLQVSKKAKLVFCPQCNGVSPPATNLPRGQEMMKFGDDCCFDSALAKKLQEQEYDASLSKNLNELDRKRS